MDVILAMTVLVLLIVAFGGVFMYGEESYAQAGDRVQGLLLAEEGLEVARSVRDRGWNELILEQSGIDQEGSEWQFSGEGTDDELGKYTRKLAFFDACRDETGDLADCSEGEVDIHTKLVQSTVSWSSLIGINQTVTLSAYLTNWGSLDWKQSSWEGGAGQDKWSDETMYQSDDGNLTIDEFGNLRLRQTAVCGQAEWGFDVAEQYDYNSEFIEVMDGSAQLIATQEGDGFDLISSGGYGSNVSEQSMLHISGNVYAVAYKGQGNRGRVETFSVSSEGVISPVITGLEFYSGNTNHPHFFHVRDNIYAVVTRGQANRGHMITFSITPAGIVSGFALDSYQFESSQVNNPKGIAITNGYVAIAYNVGNGGRLRTVRVNANGTIVNSTVSQLNFATTASAPDLIRIDNDTYAIAYVGSGSTGTVATVEINSSGIISTINDTLVFDVPALNPSLFEMTVGVYAVAYESTSGSGELTSFSIANDGTIGVIASNMTFAATNVIRPRVDAFGSDGYVVAYRGPSNRPYLALVNATGDTFDPTVVDTLEVETSSGDYLNVFSITSSVGFVGYAGQGGNGKLQSFRIGGSVTYPDNGPSIEPTGSFRGDQFSQWTYFEELSESNGGTVYYQLSDDGGASWRYWDGSSWTVTANEGQRNTAEEIDAVIHKFPVTTGEMKIRAFLESDGTQLVKLDTVKIGCAFFAMEVNQTTAADNWTEVSLQNNYSRPVVIALAHKSSNSAPVSVRVRNATQDSFEIRLERPGGGAVQPESIHYLVVEEGVWNWSGTLIEARQRKVSAVATSQIVNAEVVAYRHTFSSEPAVLHQVMSADDEAWISSFVSEAGSRNKPPGQEDFQIALSSAEVTSSNNHGPELIGWVALLPDESQNYEYIATGRSVRGHDNGCYSYNYAEPYDSPPLVIGSLQEMHDSDGGWLVGCALSSEEVGVHVEEDQVSDTERAHNQENVSLLVFDGPKTFLSEPHFSEGGGLYASSGTFTSSAFNTSAVSAIQLIQWVIDVSNCEPDCSIEVQVRAAPDEDGSPGAFTDWYGTSGGGSMFTNPNGELISTDLNNLQWVQYRVVFSGDGTSTPVLEEVKVNYR